MSERTGFLQIIWIELFHCEENYQQLCIFVYLVTICVELSQSKVSLNLKQRSLKRPKIWTQDLQVAWAACVYSAQIWSAWEVYQNKLKFVDEHKIKE